MIAKSRPTGSPESGVRLDPLWWSEGVVDGRPMREVLADREIGAVFRFLRAQGWSLTGMCAATGLKETRIRAVMNGIQRITSYEVLERVALGLRIPRGAMGLAYAAETDLANGSDTTGGPSGSDPVSPSWTSTVTNHSGPSQSGS